MTAEGHGRSLDARKVDGMDRLAIDGGPAACPPGTIPHWPMYGPGEAAALQRVLESRKWWRVPGGEVDGFERAFAALHDSQYALAVANGTLALELALSLLGIGCGDEVIVPAFTFASTATAVVRVGAIPVVVDVDPVTWCIDPAAVETAITCATRAVVPVHLAGHPCDMDALGRIALEHNLRLVGDAAHAHGARWAGRSITADCDVSIFSFQSGKLMTAGEGGIIVTNDRSLADRAWIRHSCGRPRTDNRYRHLEAGTNMRMTEFQGALLSEQLARLPGQLLEREQGAARLNQLLTGIPGIRTAGRDRRVDVHSFYMFMIDVDPEVAGISTDLLVDSLVAEGVPAFRAYRAIGELELFDGRETFGGDPPDELRIASSREGARRHETPVSSRYGRRAMWLHHAVLLGGEATQRAVVRAFEKVILKRRDARTK